MRLGALASRRRGPRLGGRAAPQHPAAPELLPGNRELQLALVQRRVDIGRLILRHPEAAVPQHDRAAAIFALRDRAFEVAIVEGMILDLDGQALVARVAGRPLGDGPGLEDTLVLEAKVVVQLARRMLLDHKAWIFCRCDGCLALRLRRLHKIALGVIGGKLLPGHGGPRHATMRMSSNSLTILEP